MVVDDSWLFMEGRSMSSTSILVAAWLGSGVSCSDGYAQLVEVNHYLDRSGKENFVQVIAWDWSPDYCRWHAQQWAIVDEWERNGKSLHFTDNHAVEVELRFSVFRETWTTYDPEVHDRATFDQRYRRRVW